MSKKHYQEYVKRLIDSNPNHVDHSNNNGSDRRLRI